MTRSGTLSILSAASPIVLCILVACPLQGQERDQDRHRFGSADVLRDPVALFVISELQFQCISLSQGEAGEDKVNFALQVNIEQASGESFLGKDSLESYNVLHAAGDWQNSQQRWDLVLKAIILALRLNPAVRQAAHEMMASERHAFGRRDLRRFSLPSRILHQVNLIAMQSDAQPYPYPVPRSPRSTKYLINDRRKHWSRWEIESASTQCGRRHSDGYEFTDEWGVPCDDIEAAIRFGGRSEFNAPFVPKGVCGLRWFSPEEACDIVQSLGVFLSFGDSVTRQLTYGLHFVLSGDYNYTVKAFDGPPFNCSCENQLNPHCPWRNVVKEPPEIEWFSRPILADWAHVTPPLWCPRWKREHTVHIHGGIFDFLPRRDVKFLQWGMEGNQDVLVYLQWGIHNDLEHPEKVIQEAWKPTIELVKASGFTDFPVICGLVVACGRKKDSKYLPKQGNDVIVGYNDHIRRWCKQQGYMVFEQYSVTLDAEDRDGTHYTPWVNIHLAQLLLNQIVRWQESQSKLKAARDSDFSDQLSTISPV